MSIFDTPFAGSETIRLYLDPPDTTHWVDVLTTLTAGEQRKMETSGWTFMSNVGEGDLDKARVGVEWDRFSFARTEAYVRAWSFNKIVSKQTIAALHPEVYVAIEKVLTAFLEARADQKKASPIEPGSEASSPSVGS